MTKLIGIDITTGLRAAAGAPLTVQSSRMFLVTLAERGPTDKAYNISSMRNRVRLFGNRQSYESGYDDTDLDFAEGGTEIYQARIVGPSATKGTKNLADVTPANTVTLTAKGEGAWSSSLEVQVVAGPISGTVVLTLVYKRGTNDEVPETSPPISDVAALVAWVNGNSNLATATNLGVGTLPVPSAYSAFSAGADDRANATSTVATAALAKFTEDMGPGVIVIPGFDMTQVTPATAIAAHCSANRRVAIITPPAGTSVATAKSSKAALNAVAGNESLIFAYPWVKIPDASSGDGQRTVSGTGFLAGIRARLIESLGIWWSPSAGNLGKSVYAEDVEYQVTDAEFQDLHAAGITVIGRAPGGGIKPLNWVSVSPNPSWFLAYYRDMLNEIAEKVKAWVAEYQQWPLDSRGDLVGTVRGKVIGGLETEYRSKGAFFEENGDRGYTVDVEPHPQNNGGWLDVVVAVRPPGSAVLFKLSVIKVDLGVAV